MVDPREFAAFWGLCGGALAGAVGLVAAYSTTAGTPLARRRAWLNLALGVLAGPIIAEAVTDPLLSMIPVLDMRGVALAIGWMFANNPRAFFDMLARVVRAPFTREGNP